MADGSALQPAAAIAKKNRARQPNESAEYRKAREALLAEEIELNRHIARVAAQRRALPPGGEVKGDYQFLGEASSVKGANPVGYYWQLLSITGWTSIHWLHTIRQKTLILSGAEDPIVPITNARIMSLLK